MAAHDDEPDWLTRYRELAPAEEVAGAWYHGLQGEAKEEAEKDPPTARAKLRRAIVDSECAQVRADATNGWKYTGAVLRAADAAAGIPAPKSRVRDQANAPAASGFGAANVSRQVAEGDGTPGTLSLWWSDFGAASSAKQLREHGVTHRLNVAAEAVGRLPKDDGIPTFDVGMVDVFEEDKAVECMSVWVEQLGEAIALLRAWRRQGAVVNVNCQMGKNRSGAVCLIWLCTECGWTMEAAATHLRTITALALGNPHMVRAAAEFLGSDDIVPLNPAGDGGGWVCISPPGTPRGAPEIETFAEQLRKAQERLAAEEARGPVSDDSSDPGDIVPMFGEDDLSDVD